MFIDFSDLSSISDLGLETFNFYDASFPNNCESALSLTPANDFMFFNCRNG